MRKVMVVDDDQLILSWLGKLLEKEGYLPILCPDSTAALATAAAQRPDLIVLDVNMPHLGGRELCARIKADKRTRGIPVIILTGEALEVAERASTLDLGAEDYLSKPVDRALLSARIRNLLRAASGPV